MTLVPLAQSPELLIASVSPRPRGGSKRAEGPAVVKMPRKVVAPSRCADHHEGLIVDSFDAARFIGSHCAFWQAEQVLAHIEVVQMATVEASTYLKNEIAKLGWRAYGTPEGRRQAAKINAEMIELSKAAGILFDLHSAGLIEFA